MNHFSSSGPKSKVQYLCSRIAHLVVDRRQSEVLFVECRPDYDGLAVGKIDAK